MTRQSTRWLLAACAAAALTGPARANGQDVAAAESLFSRGVEELKAGHYEQACPLLAESLRADPQPGTLFTLAQCEMKRGRGPTSLTLHREYLTAYSAMAPEQQNAHRKREGIARAAVEALEAEVPELTLSLVQTAPRGTVVKIDGVEVAASSLGAAIAVDVGEHTVSTRAPGGPVIEVRFVLAKGEKKSATLRVKPAFWAPDDVLPGPSSSTQGSPMPSPVDSGSSGRRLGMYVAGGVGIAGLALGSIMGAIALAKKATIEDNCGVAGVATSCRNQDGADAGNSIGTTALVSTVGFGVGIAGLGTAVVLLLTEPRANKRPVDRGAASVRFGALDSGGSHVLVGFRGLW